MKRLKEIIFFVALIVLVLPATVFAENPANIVLDQATVESVNREVTISGTITTTKPNKEVLITVLDKGVEKEEFEAETDMVNAAASIVYFNKQTLAPDGSFCFNFKLMGESGNYVFLIDSKALDGTYVSTLYFANTLWEELNALKEDTTPEALQSFRSFVESEPTSLGTTLKEYNALSDTKKNDVCTHLREFEEDYTAENFVHEWENNIIWTYINEKRNDPSSVASMIADKCSQNSEFFNQQWMTFFLNNYSTELQVEMIGDTLSDAECDSFNEFVQGVENSLVIVYVRSAEYWKDVYTIIEAENNVLGFNESTLSTFNTLTDKDAVVNALHTQGRSLTASAEIISLFDTLVAAQKTAESRPVVIPIPSTPSRDGGSWSVGVPIATIPETNEPEPETETEPVFNDLAGVEWAKEAIEYLAEKEVLSGVGDGKFEPNRYMSREELVKMLDNAFEYSKDASDIEFADVDKNAWYYGAVSGAANKGVVEGYDDNTFGIGKLVTREDAAVIFLRAFGRDSFGEAIESEFLDNDSISDYAKEAVGVLSSHGVVSGMGDGNFMPKGNLTRAEAAKIFYGLINTLNSNSGGV